MGNVETSVQERNKSLVSDRFEAWAQGNGSPFELLADDASWTIEGGSVASKTYVGRETFLREVIRPFNARMSVGLKPTVRTLCADGDVVVIFFDARGTARDGMPYANTYFWLFEMHDVRQYRIQRFLVASLSGRAVGNFSRSCRRRNQMSLFA
jgi:ketosteroid isomerase-like protein